MVLFYLLKSYILVAVTTQKFKRQFQNKMKANTFLTGFTCLLTSFGSMQAAASQWGLGISYRHSTVPYRTDVSDTVDNAVPHIYYEDDQLFLNGDEGGFKLFNEEDTRINILGRRRYVNVPRLLGNEYGMDAFDMGVQVNQQVSNHRSWRFEALTDTRWKTQMYAGHDWQFQLGNWEFQADAGLRLKSSGYNSYYYGLKQYGGESVSAGVEAQFGIDFRYPLPAGWYLTGGLEWIQLENSARNAGPIDGSGYGAIKLGVVFFEGADSDFAFDFQENAYIRVAHGWATPSNLGDILAGDAVSDEHNNQLTSVFYGHPLKENWLDLPLQTDVYLHTGLAYHYQSSVQKRAVEGIISIKAYVNMSWPTQWRFGAAQGLSYISNVTYVEESEMDRKNYETNKLMNYLDFTFDVNLGDLFNNRSLDPAWVGWSIHHRSAIFQQSSQFGRIKGGSNYNTVYLQWHY